MKKLSRLSIVFGAILTASIVYAESPMIGDNSLLTGATPRCAMRNTDMSGSCHPPTPTKFCYDNAPNEPCKLMECSCQHTNGRGGPGLSWQCEIHACRPGE